MVKGDGLQSKVHHRAADRDFVVFIDDTSALQKWKSDKTVPLVDVVQSFQIFVTEYDSTAVTPLSTRAHFACVIVFAFLYCRAAAVISRRFR